MPGRAKSLVLWKLPKTQLLKNQKVTVHPLHVANVNVVSSNLIGIIWLRHSSLIDRTKRSANAFKFGLRGGNFTVFTPPALRIAEKDPLALEMFTKHPILILKALDDVLLLSVQPSCQRHHKNLPRMGYHDGDSTVSKYRGTGPIHRIKLSCKPFSSQHLPCG